MNDYNYALDNKNKAICYYWYEIMDCVASEAASRTGYAKSTVRNYSRDIRNWYSNEYDYDTYVNHAKEDVLIAIGLARPEKVIKQIKKSFAYVVDLGNDIIKVGKTNNMSKRIYALKNQYSQDLEVLKVYEFENEEDAYLFEVILHRYFKTLYPEDVFIPQDRFEGIMISDNDWKALDDLYNKSLEFSRITFELLKEILDTLK